MSLYCGVSAGQQLLSVAFLSIALQSSTFANCSVRSNAQGGNAYGGAVSLHIGAHSSAYSSAGTAVAAAGDTVVRNVNVTLDTVDFKSCSAIREQKESSSYGANVYGGSFSFHIGAYAWSRSPSIGSTSTCGSTNASGIRVLVLHSNLFGSRALTTTSGSFSYGANSYGGSMSVFHVGAYSWSYSSSGGSSSTCGSTSAIGIRVLLQNTTSVDSRALTTTSLSVFYGAHSYGGSMSVFHVGAYSWSFSAAADINSHSTCGSTTASDVSVHVSGSGCVNCSAMSTTTSGSPSYGATSYGGALSAAFIGAYSYSYAVGGRSSSRAIIGSTEVVRLSVTIQDSTIVDAVAASGEYYRMRLIPMRTDLTLSFSIKRRRIWCQCERFL